MVSTAWQNSASSSLELPKSLFSWINYKFVLCSVYLLTKINCTGKDSGPWCIVEPYHLTQHPEYTGTAEGFSWTYLETMGRLVVDQLSHATRRQKGTAPPRVNSPGTGWSQKIVQHPERMNGQAKALWPEKLLEVEHIQNGRLMVPSEARTRPQHHLPHHSSGYCEDKAST